MAVNKSRFQAKIVIGVIWKAQFFCPQNFQFLFCKENKSAIMIQNKLPNNTFYSYIFFQQFFFIKLEIIDIFSPS